MAEQRFDKGIAASGGEWPIALLGFGAIANRLVQVLASHSDAPQVVAALVPRDRLAAAHDEANSLADSRTHGDITPTDDLDALLARRPALVVECAGQQALREYGPAILRAGVDLLVASVGALAHPELEADLRSAAREGGARLLLPSGAVGGLDALASARIAGLDEVEYASNKPVTGWRGTAAEQLVDLDALTGPTVFFTGNAREAAQRFPQNANVAAAVALAGIGFEKTVVTLAADPTATGNRHRVRARGPFGHLDMTVEGRALAANPKTSILAPMSIAKAVLDCRRELSFV